MYIDMLKYGACLAYDISMYFAGLPLSLTQSIVSSITQSMVSSITPLVPRNINALNNNKDLDDQINYYQSRILNVLNNLDRISKNTMDNLQNNGGTGICEKITHYQGLLQNVLTNLETITKNTTANLEANTLLVKEIVVTSDKND
jgi:hypothetical protein